MIKQSSTRSGWPRFWLAACVLGLLFLVGLAAASRGDDPPQRLTQEQRQELERQSGELFQSGFQLNQRWAIASAVEKMQQALQMRERLYPKSEHPASHADLANSLGAVLEAQGNYGAARGYLDQALAMRQALYPKERYPDGHLDLAISLNNLGALLRDQGAYADARG